MKKDEAWLWNVVKIKATSFNVLLLRNFLYFWDKEPEPIEAFYFNRKLRVKNPMNMSI